MVLIAGFVLMIITGAVTAYAQESARKVKVGVYDNPPKIFTDEDGKPSGFFVDLIAHMSEKLDFEVKYVPVTWQRGLKALDSGDIDIMPDVTLTTERLRKYRFNEVAILENWASLYIHEDTEPSYYTVQDIKGKAVAVLTEDSNYQSLKTEMGSDSSAVTFLECKTYSEVFDALEAKTVDLGLVSYYFGVYRDDAFNVKQLPLVINPNTVHLAALNGRYDELLHQIDMELISLKLDEESLFYSLVDEWLASETYFKFPRWLSWLLAVLAITLFLLLVTILTLQVKLQRGKDDLTRINEELTEHIQTKVLIEENLRNRNRELAKTNEAMDQLMYQVSHNLRAPIASVLGLINLIRLEVPGEQMTGNPINKMEGSMQRLDAIISDILDYYRNSRTTIATDEVDFEALIKDVYASMSHINRSEKIEMKTDIVQHAPLYTDGRRLKSVMHNLISNALKHFDPDKTDRLCR
ncbi:MAG: transporter substrate-binding domain-containing protein [Cyclobacteriaceae bacterium]